MWHKGVRWHHVESDILKEGPGQKHPGRWGIVEHQIPSIKVLFKTNVKSHKHPGIKLLSSESKTQSVNQRKQNSYRRAYIYIYIFINTELLDGSIGHQEEAHHPTHRFRRLFLDLLSMGWRGCASAMEAIKLPPSCSSPKIMCIWLYIMGKRGQCDNKFRITNNQIRLLPYLINSQTTGNPTVCWTTCSI